MEKYNPQELEKKWQQKWEESGIYKNYSRGKKFYALDMFPYPSGAGLHVGHPKGYIATDVVSRFKMLNGYSVLHPMGWDAFGLPAENYAIKNKIHPRIAVEENIATFKKQLELFGFTYDWDKEINTTDPEYYKWTQWIFLKLYEKGLAYESEEPVNWCPSCKTVLANEDLEHGLCERCGSQVVQKKLRQWVLRMTEYADRLLEDLDREDLNWEESIILQQKNWIGRSEGAQFEMKIKGSEEKIEVYTTRVDTVYGMTYAVVAPEHEIIKKLKDQITNYPEVEQYLIAAQNKTTLERTELQKEKTGVKLEGLEVINPFTDEPVPLFVADYVLGNYGTGAVMAVPAHDERDFEFAKKYNLPIKKSVAPYVELTGVCSPRAHKETTRKDTVTAIIKHPHENKYLLLKWQDLKGFAGGGIEHDESPQAAIIREIKEETGYLNFHIANVIIDHLYGHGYKARKDKNNFDHDTVFLVQLDDLEKENVAAAEVHEIMWADEEEVESLITLDHHLYMWLQLKNKVDAFTNDGVLINSASYSGLSSDEARQKITEWLEKEGIGKKKINYKMRDWVFSRQRYWGEPIPMLHCEKCGTVAVPEDQLPVRLPEVENYEPTGTGEGPLAAIDEWVNTTCPKCGGPAKRETNTMPQWAGSSWYYLRYIDSKNKEKLIDPKLEKEWMPVDLYVGGAEHATRHLLYARFWHKFLFDLGVVSTTEPFKKLVHVGLIMAEDGRKMSKRWNNVINPNDVIGQFGADSMRVYEMFMGPFTQSVAWNTNGVSGVRRFLDKVWNLQERIVNHESGIKNKKIDSLIHKTIKKVSEDIENFKFNTAISQLMVCANFLEKENEISMIHYSYFLILLSPFAPHITEELWEKLGNSESVFLQTWPEYDAQLAKDEEIEMVVQVNGKVRDRLMVAADVTEDEAKETALESPKVMVFTEGKEIKKIIFVPGKLINIVTNQH